MHYYFPLFYFRLLDLDVQDDATAAVTTPGDLLIHHKLFLLLCDLTTNFGDKK